MGRGKKVLAKITDIKPYGLIVNLHNKKCFIYEREISDFFIPDLKLKFKIGEHIFIEKIGHQNKFKKEIYSYKSCHLIEKKYDSLFLMLKKYIDENEYG